MATVVGEVSSVTGTVVAIDASGNERILNVGDQVFAGETVRTGDGAFVAIALVDGGRFDLGRNGEAILGRTIGRVDSGCDRRGRRPDAVAAGHGCRPRCGF